jgi:hypothetical protein
MTVAIENAVVLYVANPVEPVAKRRALPRWLRQCHSKEILLRTLVELSGHLSSLHRMTESFSRGFPTRSLIPIRRPIGYSPG